eukprot:5663118-Pleurochrysis_carterae.AAC.1
MYAVGSEECSELGRQELTGVVAVKGGDECAYSGGCIAFGAQEMDSLESRVIVHQHQCVLVSPGVRTYKGASDVSVYEASGIRFAVELGGVRVTCGVSFGAGLTAAEVTLGEG